MQRLVILGIVLLFPAGAIAQDATVAQTQGAKTARAQAIADRRVAIDNAATDASLRSSIAVPKFELAAEVAEDKKTATAKVGFAWPSNFTGEFGFSGAFDQKPRRSPLTSLRQLSPGSSAWFALSWKQPRVWFDYAQMNTVCLQAAWAEDTSALQFDCRLSTLPAESFAERLAAVAVTPARGLCQQFMRAVHTGTEVAAGDVSSECELFDLNAFERQHGERYTASYKARYDALVASANVAAAADLCNEFRRSRALPSAGSKCDPAGFGKQETVDFARSWKARFDSFRTEREAEICNEYRRAKGLAPTNASDCRPVGEDPVFLRSFKDRFAATHRWLGSPILNARVDVGRPSFEYREESNPTADATEVNKYSHAVTGTAGWLTASDLLFAFNVTFGQSWRAPDAIELCQPISGTVATKCEEEIVLGPPKPKRKALLEWQVQRPIGPTALALFLTVNARRTEKEHKREWGIEAPFYFLKDKGGGLAGGVVFNYRHGPDNAGIVKDTVDVSVFIGQVFKAF